MTYLPRRSRWPLPAFAVLAGFVCMIGVAATYDGPPSDATVCSCPPVGWDSRAERMRAAELDAEIKLLRLALPPAVNRSFLEELAEDPFEWQR